MGQPNKMVKSPIAYLEDDDQLESRRQRPASEIRFPSGSGTWADARPANLATGGLSPELRASLWSVIDTFVFATRAEIDHWNMAVTVRPAVGRIWTSPPISASSAVPEDVSGLLGSWFSLVEPSDVYELVASIHDNIEASFQESFAAACNAALEDGVSDHRFVAGRLISIASRADVATIERALATCRNVPSSEAHLRNALDRLASKPEPDCRGAIHEAIRAVETMAFALMGEQPTTLAETLEDLEWKGYIDGPLKSAYSSLLAYASETRTATTEHARLIVVMCATFVGHLAMRIV